MSEFIAAVPVHPVAERFPLMQGEDFDVFVNSVSLQRLEVAP